MLEIKTNQLATRKHVLIDGVGYTVRKFSNLEQLNMSQYKRRIDKLIELEKNNESEAHEKEAEEINRKIFEMYTNLFDDGGDQSKSKILTDSLSYEEIGLILKDIFTEETINEQSNS